MSALKIYADVMSQPSRAILIFCRAAKVPHEFKPIMVKEGMNKTEEFTRINPHQKVPAAEHNGVPMNESLAIMRYIANTHKIDDHWYPKDPVSQLKVDQYLDWQHVNTRVSCAMFFRSKWLLPIMTGKPVDHAKVKSWQGKMEATLDDIENVFLNNGKHNYIGGQEKPSVADIWACCELEQPSMAGYDVRTNRPILDAYMQRVKAQLNPHYDDAHKIVYKFVEKFGGKIPGSEEEPKSKV